MLKQGANQAMLLQNENYLQQRMMSAKQGRGLGTALSRQSYASTGGAGGGTGYGTSAGSLGTSGLGNSRSDGYGHSGGGHSGGGYGHSGGGGGGYGHSGGGYGGGYSQPSYGSYSSGYMDCPGIPIALLLVTLLGIAVMGAILYMKIVAAGARRKRSNLQWIDLQEMFLIGLEEFEEKIDKIADGEDAGDDSWISKIYNQFSFFNDGDNSLAEADMDGLEPPILDETWGLGVRKTDITANTTVSRAVALDESEKETGRTKRSVEEGVIEKNSEDTEAIKDIKDPEEKCRVDMWRCLSQVIEGGLHYMDRPEGLMGLAKKTMFKMAFHGGLSNLWSGVMTIPEARAVKHCMTSHTECVSYEILRREAQATLDPTDPAYSMYDRGTGTRGETQEPASQGKESKRERLIINPEYVESLDTGDGSVQYDEDYTENHI